MAFGGRVANSRKTGHFNIVIWAELPSSSPQTTLKPDGVICWKDKWVCNNFYDLSPLVGESCHSFSNLTGSLQFFSLSNPSSGLICITVLLLFVFLGSGLLHWNLL